MGSCVAMLTVFSQSFCLLSASLTECLRVPMSCRSVCMRNICYYDFRFFQPDVRYFGFVFGHAFAPPLQMTSKLKVAIFIHLPRSLLDIKCYVDCICSRILVSTSVYSVLTTKLLDQSVNLNDFKTSMVFSIWSIVVAFPN